MLLVQGPHCEYQGDTELSAGSSKTRFRLTSAHTCLAIMASLWGSYSESLPTLPTIRSPKILKDKIKERSPAVAGDFYSPRNIKHRRVWVKGFLSHLASAHGDRTSQG